MKLPGLEINVSGNPGAFCIGLSAFYGACVPIGGLDERMRGRTGGDLCEGGVPEGFVEAGPIHEGEAAVNPRGDTKREKGGESRRAVRGRERETGRGESQGTSFHCPREGEFNYRGILCKAVRSFSPKKGPLGCG
jgi:hypothetical protein